MALRKACAYSKKYARPYTRKSKVKNQNYIKTIPQQKVVKFQMGNITAFEQGKYPFVLKLISKQKVIIRDISIEASRQVIHHDLENGLPGAYYFSVRKYPHHILRENTVFSGGSDGAGVNRGIQQCFGSALGRAAFIEIGEPIFIVAFADKKFLPLARNALEKIKPKLPCATKIAMEKIK